MEFKNEVPDNILDDHNADISNNDPDDWMADLSKYVDGIQRAEEIRVSIAETTAERAATVRKMMKKKSPSLIKSIIDRLNGN